MVLRSRPPPSREARFREQEIAILRPALGVLSWKTRALVVQTRSVLFVPPQGSSHAVFLPIECVPSCYAPRRSPQLYPTEGTGKRFMSVELRNNDKRSFRRGTAIAQWSSNWNCRENCWDQFDIGAAGTNVISSLAAYLNDQTSGAIIFIRA